MSSSKERTVYVGNIDPRVNKEDLYELFVQFGRIKKINYPRDKVLDTHQGYAFIEFLNDSTVDYVLKLFGNTNLVSLYERSLKIRKSENGKEANANGTNKNIDVDMLPIAKIIVKNVDESVDIMKLNKICSKFGKLARDSDIVTMSNGMRCGFVHFRDYKDSDLAIDKLNNELIVNKRISVEYALKGNAMGNTKYGTDTDRLLNREAIKNGLL
ncbi:hypothetical protein KAFR_0D01660 [Kazachstania africana CBS 2517]|uniref:RRM domain-containing protein n=1 Tax=Kazachstania africana (strain ATCC 22294 / BCRC 22015 / CBS 2517 / CECT 1963 / NBRC 1671 / NRRL Y-8276) TaxID=1071382 RepID=H2ATW2_KAZAF|nr:hypothetical protein KAFR_0D01660 [Kazachstania africana CBS 2517]CCF57812.1 hypothetical protein KAFR_0D01660 [Kazachstania africana CBS 2517]